MFPLNPFESMKKQFYFAILIIAIILILIILLPTVFGSLNIKQTKQIQEPAHILTVSAQGKASLTPDLAVIQAGVKTIESTAIKSQQENSKKMNKVIEAIKGEGVEKKDIQTTNYNLRAVYDWTEKGKIFKGYETSQNVTVKIRDLDAIGKILEQINLAGANQIGGINFTFDDPENLKIQTSQKAIAKAKEKAKLLAQSAGIKLGNIISLSESSAGISPRLDYSLAKGLGGGEEEIAPEIEPGESEITSQVTLVFEIK